MEKDLIFNLSFHNEEEQIPEVEADFDTETLIQRFEEEYQEPESEAETEEDIVENEEPEDDQPDAETQDENTEPQNNEEAKPPAEEDKAGKAFAEMRNQLKEKEIYENFVKNLSDYYGMNPEELMAQFEEQKLQKEAEEKNVDPEVLKRLRALEHENELMRQKTEADKFNNQVEETLKKYNITADHPTVQKAFQLIRDRYMNYETKTPTIDFADAYFLANREDLINQEIEAATQKQLEEKRKRQQTSALPVDDAPTSADADEITSDEVRKILDSMDISI